MMKNKTSLFLIACWCYGYTSFAQNPLKGAKYAVEAGAFASTAESNPFWVRSNQFGEVPLGSPAFSLRGELKKDYDSLTNVKAKRKLQFGYGARAVANVGESSRFFFSEFYGKARYGAFEFYAGRRKEIAGLVDSTLSMGSYTWSGNALPMPKVQIGLFNYMPLLKNGLISFKANFAHGWFGSGDSTKKYFLHQKSAYFRLGKPAWKMKFYAGINHQVQWGGRPTVPFVQSGTNSLITNYGSDLEAFIHVATGISLQALGYYKKSGRVSGEGGNRLGNHLGTVDIGLEYQNEATKWFFYRQSIYEDGSLFVLSSIADGLLGASIELKEANQGVKKIVLEYLNTSNQGGNLQSGNQTAFIPELRGADDYFNNGTYEEGWVYRKQTIGTPFIMPLSASTGVTLKDLIGDFQPKSPVMPDMIINNRVKAWMLGIHSRISRVNLLTRVSYSQNFGKYYLYSRVLLAPIELNQVSVQQQVSFAVKKYTINAIVAYDNAGLLENNIGGSLVVRREF